ncbi:MAG: radical SAM protein [Clostridia bacterium]|nr:radical SAM protein [Clostridia bacterium]
MNFTLHLTADCNFACRYCYEKHTPARMDERTALAACELLFSYGHRKNGFSFFGGEPLLLKDVIGLVVHNCAEKAAKAGSSMSYQLTTNGSLLNEAFLRLADAHGIRIALSHDGCLQDEQRLLRGGGGTAALLEPKIDMLLAHQPNAVAMMTIEKRNLPRLAEAVKWLYARGFSRVNTAIDYRPSVDWNDDDMAELGLQYGELAVFAAEHFDDERPLHYLNFESKVAAYINGRRCIECELGMKQPSIAPDGVIYPCNQFVGVPEFAMGNVFDGIDKAAQRRIYEAYRAPEPTCEGCALDARCRHHCACLNFSMTGDMHTVPPVQCAHERAVIKYADRMAELLYERKSPRFMRVYGNTEE